MTVRHGHPSDLWSLYEICHQTGFAGRDASEVVSDRSLLGHYFAAPYLVRDPAWCWVAADDTGVAGYLVATPDSRAFAAWMEASWLPAVRRLFPVTDDPRWSPTEAWLRRTVHQPMSVPDLAAEYPAHLHVDLLPRAQGHGQGTRLFAAFEAQLVEAGVPGFHLGVSEENPRAQGFYAKLGLTRLRVDPGVVYWGRRFRG